MGAPAAPPPADVPAYAPPPAYAAPPVYTQNYDTGSVVAMAPIPNPGDGAPAYGDGMSHHRVHAHYEPSGAMADNTVRSPYGEGHWAAGHKPAAPAYQPAPTPAPAPAYKPPVIARAAPAPAPVHAPAPAKAPVVKTIEHKTAVAAAAASAAAAGAAAEAHHAAVQAKQAAVAAAQKTAPPAPAPAAAPQVSGDRNSRLASLQTSLTDAIGKTAVLAAPASFTANQPTDVSLTIPAAFAETLRSEAQKDGLGDAAASVNMTAVLSGDGFAVTPDDVQSAPLAAGQPTEFHWTVTAQPGAKGPLHADVGADLLGGGSDKLALGSVQKSAGMGVKLTPRVIGASLLVLIAALVVAWLARGRGPTRSAAARRASRRAARGGRPLDMSGGESGAA